MSLTSSYMQDRIMNQIFGNIMTALPYDQTVDLKVTLRRTVEREILTLAFKKPASEFLIQTILAKVNFQQFGNVCSVAFDMEQQDYLTMNVSVLHSLDQCEEQAVVESSSDVDIESQEDQVDLTFDRDTILIAEDNSDLRIYIESILSPTYNVLTASDGLEALELVIKNVPSLVLSDVMMPGMDGVKLLSKIKADERTCHIPVILLTVKGEQQSKFNGLRSGADDYIAKPFSIEEVQIRIGNLIEQRRRLAEKYRESINLPASPVETLSLEERFIYKVREVVENNMKDFNLSVGHVADELNLSRTQLLRKLKALTGLSPNEFIKDIRLKRAADLIMSKSDRITQIGYSVGFNDQSYFTKCFKKKFGITPSEYVAKTEAGFEQPGKNILPG